MNRTQLLTLAEAAGQLACSRSYVYRLIAAGDLHAVDIKASSNTRSKTRVRVDEVEAFIARRTTP